MQQRNTQHCICHAKIVCCHVHSKHALQGRTPLIAALTTQPQHASPDEPGLDSSENYSKITEALVQHTPSPSLHLLTPEVSMLRVFLVWTQTMQVAFTQCVL